MNEPIATETSDADAPYTVTHNPNPNGSPEPSTSPTDGGEIAGAPVESEQVESGQSADAHHDHDHHGHDHHGHDHHDHAHHDHSHHDHGHDHTHDHQVAVAAPNEPVSGESDVDMDALNETLEYIRPALQADGGDLVLLGGTGGTVNLQLVGACGGCPMSTMTLKQGIERIIFDRVAGATEVVAI